MDQENTQEKKNKRVGMFTAIVLHVVLILVFFFMIAWKEEIPPPQPIGMSMNFGTSSAGSGDVQPERTETQEQEAQEEVQEEMVEEPVTEPVTETQTDPVETDQPDVSETIQKEGPVKVDEPVEVKPKEEVTPKEETQQEEQKVQNVYTGPKSDQSNEATSQGTVKNAYGDQGDKDGTLNDSAGRGDGAFGIDGLSGWGTRFRLPDDKPDAQGVLEFKIKIDDRGDVVSIRTSKMIGNPEAEKFYKELILREMRFYRTQGGDTPAFSEGTITLNLKVK